MKLFIYSYKDERTGAYGFPQYTAMSKEHILTMAKRAALSGNAAELKNATLYLLGTFDDEAGTFQNKIERIANLGEMVGVHGTEKGQ